MSEDYPEIASLKHFFETNQIRISWDREADFKNIYFLKVMLKDALFSVLVHDEFWDLKHPNVLLHLVLVLNEWELIVDSTDYLDWCQQQGFAANNEQLRRYYQDTLKVLPQISNYFPNGSITSFISDFDFQLNAGAAQYLRNTTYQ